MSKKDIEELENKLTEKIQELVNSDKNIKIYNDLDIRALAYTKLTNRKQMQLTQESKTDDESTDNDSSTKTKQAPTDDSTPDQPELSHKRDEELDSEKSTD